MSAFVVIVCLKLVALNANLVLLFVSAKLFVLTVRALCGVTYDVCTVNVFFARVMRFLPLLLLLLTTRLLFLLISQCRFCGHYCKS